MEWLLAYRWKTGTLDYEKPAAHGPAFLGAGKWTFPAYIPKDPDYNGLKIFEVRW